MPGLELNGNGRRLVATPVSSVPAEMECDRLVVFVLQGDGEAIVPEAFVDALGPSLLPAMRRAGFAGAPAETFIVDPLGRISARIVAFVGVGAAGMVRDAVVSAAACAGVGDGRTEIVGLCLGEVPSALLSVAVEGLVIGAHRYSPSDATARRGPPRPELELRVAQGEVPAGWERSVELGTIVGGSVCWVRDLVDLPSNVATPSRMVEEARYLASEAPVTCEVLDAPELARLGFGGVLAVGGGGEHPPCVVVLRYQANGHRPVGIVGKGVTFDSGGYHMKPLDEMILMKSDMAGAAAAMGALRAVALCGLRQDLVVVLPFVENLVGRASYRPGDVITHFGGKTCEVVDPDNEGRLVLADGIGYVTKYDPTAIVDIGTLTDGSGLGRDLWALFANDRAIAKKLLDAGEVAGEPGWELPLWRPYRDKLKSNVADVANANRSVDSAVLAALFLDHFVDGVPWAHIDLGDSALRVGDLDERATGVGVRALWQFIRSVADERP